ncbi:MAG: hypothetical protein ACE1ZX_05360, partial [Acidimicrobiia bacterium]
MSKTMYAVAILLCAQSAHGDVLFFLNEAEFQATLQQAGKVLEGFEDFPWLAPSNSVIGSVGSVDVNLSVPGWLKPGVLIDNLTFQPNLGGADSSQVSPNILMALFTMDYLDLPANGLVSSHFASALDIISGAPNPANHTAMGMTINSIWGGPTVRVDVYDENNVLIGNTAAAPAGMDGAFLGILATGGNTLGRVNLYDPSGGAEGMFNISVWVSVPCP